MRFLVGVYDALIFLICLCWVCFRHNLLRAEGFSTLQGVADSFTDSNVLRAFFLGLHVIWIDENKRLPTFWHCRGSAFHKPNAFGHSLQCSGHEYSGLDVTGVLVSRPKVVHMYPS